MHDAGEKKGNQGMGRTARTGCGWRAKKRTSMRKDDLRKKTEGEGMGRKRRASMCKDEIWKRKSR